MFRVISGCPKLVKFQGKSMADGNTLVPGGNDFDTNRTTRYICRALYKGNFFAGKYRNARQSCHFIWEGLEHSRTSSFQILRMSNLQSNNVTLKWVKSSSVPAGTVEGGMSSDGEPLYVPGIFVCTSFGEPGYPDT